MAESAQTLATVSLGWGVEQGELQPEVLHLVIAWSRDEPHRLGEAAPVGQPSVLGRGDHRPEDPATRVTFFQQRPWGATARPPLEGSRISRLQLELSPTADERLAVRSLGRCALLINGTEASSGVVGPGDTLMLHNAMVLLVVRRSQSVCMLRSPLAALSFSFGRADPHGFVGESPAAWGLRDALAFAAQSEGHVLVQGESGTGKELASAAIHALSSRAGRAFVARNAATFPEGLVDAELFGTAKGYPNAGTPERPGLIAEADGGTLFLDEIGELPPPLQAHLLRVLDRGGEYQRLGESRPRRSNLRVVAATNRPLEALKHDFAARFALRVEMPGLAPRREDIPLLLSHLLTRVAEGNPAVAGRFFERRGDALAEPRVDPRLVEALLRHRYTHHLRELERLMWLGLSTSTGPFVALTPQLAAELRLGGSDDGTDRSGSHPAEAAAEQDAGHDASQLGRAEIETALARAKGSVTAAARLLGLKNRFVLYRLLKRHGIAMPEGEPGEG
jgi:DNA-binding NtrC family response regulator